MRKISQLFIVMQVFYFLGGNIYSASRSNELLDLLNDSIKRQKEINISDSLSDNYSNSSKLQSLFEKIKNKSSESVPVNVKNIPKEQTEDGSDEIINNSIDVQVKEIGEEKKSEEKILDKVTERSKQILASADKTPKPISQSSLQIKGSEKEVLTVKKTPKIVFPVIMEGEYIEYKTNEDKVIIKGNSYVKYKDMQLFANIIQVDNKTETIFAYGDCLFLKKDGKKNSTSELRGEFITYNLRSGMGWIRNGKSETQMQNGTIYYTAEKIEVDLGKTIAENAVYTTCDHIKCDHEIPHYKITAQKLIAYPKNKMIMKNANFYLGNQKVFYMKTKIVDLREKEKNNWEWKLGYTKAKKAYLKLNADYWWNESFFGKASYTMNQRTGMDYSLSNNYKFKDKAQGTVNLSYIDESREFSGTGVIEEHFRIYKQMSVNHSYKFNPITNGSINLNYTSDSTQGSAPNEELNLDVNASHSTPAYNLNFNVKQRFDVDDDNYTGDNFYSVLDKEPELRFSTNTRNIFNSWITYNMSGLIGKYYEKKQDYTVGNFVETSSGKQDYKFNVSHKPIDLLGFGKFRMNSAYRKALYSTDDEFESVNSRANLDFNIDKAITSSWTYNYKTTTGKPAFSYDSETGFNRIDGDFKTRLFDRVDVTLIKGNYDFQNKLFSGFYSDLRVGSIGTDGPKWTLYLQSNYTTPEKPAWNDLSFSDFDLSSVYLRYNYRYYELWDTSLSTTYNDEQSKFTDVNNTLTMKVGPKWNLSVSTRYDFGTDKFTRMSYQADYDMHCWIANFSWDKNTEEFLFGIKFKVFPDKRIDLRHNNDLGTTRIKFGNEELPEF